MTKRNQLVISFAVLLPILCFLAIAAFFTGPSELGLKDFISTISNGDNSSEWIIFFRLRLPRIIFAIAVGAALSASGTVFQSLLKNPLAEPYLLGVSSGAAVGAISAIKMGLGGNRLVLTGLAYVGGLATIIIVYSLSRRGGTIDGFRMIMGGVIINSFLSALLLSFFALAENWDIQAILFWMMGNLGTGSVKMSFVTLGMSIIGIIILVYFSKDLNLIMVDDESATSLGVKTEHTKICVFFTASFLTAVCVASCGIIGFVGLIVPHGTRLVWGSDNRLVIPLASIVGSIFLLGADSIARTVISPDELPVGVITAIVGTPVFLFLMYRNRTS